MKQDVSSVKIVGIRIAAFRKDTDMLVETAVKVYLKVICPLCREDIYMEFEEYGDDIVEYKEWQPKCSACNVTFASIVEVNIEAECIV